MDKDVRLKDILEEARLGKGLSREAAAKALEATPPTYRGWLRGQQPELYRIPALMSFTGRPKGDIVTAIENQAKGLQLSWPVLSAA